MTQNSLSSANQIDCSTCWCKGPKFTVYFSALVVVSMLITSIYDLTQKSISSLSLNYTGLVPYYTVQKYELWRMITCHLCVSSLWSIMFYGFVFFTSSYRMELIIGPKIYVTMLLVATLVSTVLALLIAAFFSQIPGLNEWDYFSNFWLDSAATGPTQICILVSII